MNIMVYMLWSMSLLEKGIHTSVLTPDQMVSILFSSCPVPPMSSTCLLSNWALWAVTT